MTALDRLDAIRERAERATPGPWTISLGAGWWVVTDRADLFEEVASTGHVSDDAGASDAEFIAASRDDIDALESALRKVLELHQPQPVHRDQQGWLNAKWWCDSCSAKIKADRHGKPIGACPTVRAIEEALDGS